MRARCLALALGLVPLACEKQGTTTEPQSVPVATVDASPAGDPGEPASEPAADPVPADASADTSASATPAGRVEPEAADAGAETEIEPSVAGGAGAPAAKAKPELPKALHGKVDASCGNDPGVGEKLKSFALKSVDGKPVSHKSWKNRVLLVNFWGTWCKPCLAELPEFEQLYRRYRKHGLTLVAIATDEDPTPVKEYLASRKISAKVVIGAEAYAEQYGSPKFPFSFVVDTGGVIRASFRGYRPECLGTLEAELRRELEARAEAD